MPSRVLTLLIVPIFVCALVAACGSSESTPAATATATGPAPMKMTFFAGFKAQADLPFVGVYVAQEKGYFAAENLEVEIRHGTPGTNDALQAVLAGSAQVTTGDASAVLLRRSEGAPVVSIALVGQQGEQGLVALADSGIKTPKDFEGKTVGYRTYPSPEYLAMLKQAGVDRSKITEVNLQNPDVRLLTEGQVDVLPVFLSNEPFKLQQLGKQVVVFDPGKDFGVPSYGLTYMTTEDVVANQPEMLRRFLRAAIRGIYYAIDHPDEAIEITLKYAPMEQRDAQRFILDSETKHALTDLTKSKGIGWQTPEQWDVLAKFLADNGGVQGQVDPSKAFTTQFLEQVYANGVPPK